MKSLKDKWHCSWCDFMHEDLDKVVEHENREHPEKKQWKKSFSAEKSLVVVNHKNGEFAGKVGRYIN